MGLVRPLQMPYDCGNPNCTIRSDAGKDFERVVSYAMETLKNIFDLAATVQSVAVSYTQTDSPRSAQRTAALAAFLKSRTSVENKPFDQDLLEASWSMLEDALQYFTEPEKLLFRVWVRPTEPTLAEMAFCRVVDGWKFYMQELSGTEYGDHRGVLEEQEKTLDKILNKTRNLFVHYDGVLGLDRRQRKHTEIFKALLAEVGDNTSRLVDICRHAAGLVEGDRLLLGMQETVNYLDEIAQLLENIEARHFPMA